MANPRVARGTSDPANDGIRQIAARFPVAQFDKISQRAVQSGVPFATKLRQLVEIGLKHEEAEHAHAQG